MSKNCVHLDDFKLINSAKSFQGEVLDWINKIIFFRGKIAGKNLSALSWPANQTGPLINY